MNFKSLIDFLTEFCIQADSFCLVVVLFVALEAVALFHTVPFDKAIQN